MHADGSDLDRLPLAILSTLSREIAVLYASTGRGDFTHAMYRFLGLVVPFDDMTIFRQHGDERPELLWSSFRSSVAGNGIRNYVEATYVVDPFVRAFRSGAPAGAYRAIDLAKRKPLSPDHESCLPLSISPHEELGFRTTHWPESLAELQIVFDGGDRTACFQVGLYRESRHDTFSPAEARRLTALTPIVAGPASEHWRIRATARPVEDGSPLLLLLTPRERAVIEMVARGYRSEAIADLLGIGIETVKTHRKRAYRKLAISSQAELFALMRDTGSGSGTGQDASDAA